MKLTHGGLFADHLRSCTIVNRVYLNFCWPGIHGDVTRFCQTYDICQRTVTKGKVSKVPLQNMPVCKAPFDRIAVDLTGPIFLALRRIIDMF